jgi:hypothetical protein
MAALTTALNANPIITTADADTASGWRAAQTLNVGNLPTNAQQNSGAVTRQWGIQVYKIALIANATTLVAGQITVSDPKDNTVLWSASNIVTTGQQIGEILVNQDLNTTMKWRDFKVVGLTASSCALMIWYRA